MTPEPHRPNPLQPHRDTEQGARWRFGRGVFVMLAWLLVSPAASLAQAPPTQGEEAAARLTSPLFIQPLIPPLALPNDADVDLGLLLAAQPPVNGLMQPPVQASPSVGMGAMGGLAYVFIFGILGELLIPDVHIELHDDAGEPIHWSLSWPIPVTVFRLEGEGDNNDLAFSAAIQLEPQYDATGECGRFLGTLRLIPSYDYFALMAEAGGVLGGDGDGLVIGGGIGASVDGFVYIGANYRRIFTGPSDRHDISVDLMIPIPAFDVF